MRYKVVPPVRDRSFLEDVAEAVPLVPGSEADCCTRIRDRTAVAARDDAREWLTFCQALGLVAETERGFHRVRDPPSDDRLAANYRDQVFGVEESLAALADRSDPVPAESVFERAVEPIVPRWERSRSDDWEATWRERTDRLLGWAVVFGLADRIEDQGGGTGYRLLGDGAEH